MKIPNDEEKEKMQVFNKDLWDTISKAKNDGIHAGSLVCVISSAFVRILAACAYNKEDAYRLFIKTCQGMSEQFEIAIEDVEYSIKKKIYEDDNGNE
jgi:hypothetical protein